MDADDGMMGADDSESRQRPEYISAGNTAGSSQISDATLNYLLKHLRTTDERSAKMASQVDQLSRAVLSALELRVLGTNHVTPAQTPPVKPSTRQNGAPGTFRESVPDTKHKSLKDTQFHVSRHCRLLAL